MLSNLIFKFFSGIRVVHSIPGRMRVQVVGLNSLDNEFRQQEDYVKKLVLLLEGIKDIEVSYITNKILLHYDTKLLSEEKIVKWLKIVEEELFQHRDLLSELTQDNFEQLSKELFEKIQKKLN